MNEVEERIISIFLDTSKRPKITPRHESAIITMLESEYSIGKVTSGLQRLEETGTLVAIKKTVKDVGDAKFYFLSQYNEVSSIQKIRKKIDISAEWIRKYSDDKVTKMIGDHLHDVVKAELRVQGFDIAGEKTRKYQGREWTETKENLDIIAKHKTRNLTVGIEIKNMLPLAPISEVISKIKMCNYLRIIPLFACRWIEPHRNEIVSRGGFLWQFKKQLYPRGQERFVEAIRKRFKFPVEVNSELPPQPIKEFEDWIRTFPN